MNNRWYDTDPTMSMAVSLLQNAQLNHRDIAVLYINNWIKQIHPGAYQQIQKEENNGFFAILQRRRSMAQDAWQAIESIRFLPEEDRRQLAIELIRFIYCLENDEFDEETFNSTLNLEAAL